MSDEKNIPTDYMIYFFIFPKIIPNELKTNLMR